MPAEKEDDRVFFFAFILESEDLKLQPLLYQDSPGSWPVVSSLLLFFFPKAKVLSSVLNREVQSSLCIMKMIEVMEFVPLRSLPVQLGELEWKYILNILIKRYFIIKV